MNEDLRVFLATIYGEAAMSSIRAWMAVASVILNRVGHREWKKYTTPFAVVTNTGFDAFSQKNAPYKIAYELLVTPNRIDSASPLSRLQSAIEPIYHGTEPITTDAVLYWSPKAQAALRIVHPGIWREKPNWNFDLLEQVYPEGCEHDDFSFFRYKKIPARSVI